jgi:ATP-binding cassette subfamily B protein
VLGTTPLVVDAPDPIEPASRRGAVRFTDVRFGYDDADPVLDGFSLDIEPGTSVAIVGGTGSGKSTIARLLVRFYDPDAGSIELDGVDLRDRTVHDVRRSVGLVFEDTLLFHDSVSANIAFANPDADEATIRRAAELAGAADFIDELPDGYDTVLGERGFSLSGGQRQRIAIARAVVSDPSVLILDDATSAVDPSKEHEIRAAMETVMDGRTTIVIAHRPGTIAMADRVVLIGNGRVLADGSHDELLATDQRYRDVLAAAGSPPGAKQSAIAAEPDDTTDDRSVAPVAGGGD